MVEQVTQTAFMQENAILDLIDGMASQLKRQLQQNGISEAAMIGIHTGGRATGHTQYFLLPR